MPMGIALGRAQVDANQKRKTSPIVGHGLGHSAIGHSPYVGSAVHQSMTVQNIGKTLLELIIFIIQSAKLPFPRVEQYMLDFPTLLLPVPPTGSVR